MHGPADIKPLAVNGELAEHWHHYFHGEAWDKSNRTSATCPVHSGFCHLDLMTSRFNMGIRDL